MEFQEFPDANVWGRERKRGIMESISLIAAPSWIKGRPSSACGEATTRPGNAASAIQMKSRDIRAAARDRAGIAIVAR